MNSVYRLARIEDFDIRELEPTDHEVLRRFFADNDTLAVMRQFNPFPLNAEMARYISLLPHWDHFYGAFLAEEILGISMLRGWDEGYSVPSFGVLVDHRCRQRGIGGQLLDFTIAEACALGCDQLRLSVYASNQTALSLYRSRGFAEHSRRPVVVAGERDEKLVMFLDLQQYYADND